MEIAIAGRAGGATAGAAGGSCILSLESLHIKKVLMNYSKAQGERGHEVGGRRYKQIPTRTSENICSWKKKSYKSDSNSMFEGQLNLDGAVPGRYNSSQNIQRISKVRRIGSGES